MRHTQRTPFPNAPRNIRIDAGLKLREVSALTGWSTPVVSRIEHDRRNPTALTLAVFYAACGRDDLVEPLLHVLDDAAQERVFAVVDRRYDMVRQREERLARGEARRAAVEGE